MSVEKFFLRGPQPPKQEANNEKVDAVKLNQMRAVLAEYPDADASADLLETFDPQTLTTAFEMGNEKKWRESPAVYKNLLILLERANLVP